MNYTSLALFILLSVAYVTADAKQPSNECLSWFNSSNIKPGSNSCETDCAMLMTDMNTFTCPDQCDALCEPEKKPSILEKFIYYPGLTAAEKRLISEHPKDAINVFRQMQLAESAAARNFPNQNRSDEADAFRHFMWSGLLTKELGPAKAKQFLAAHEANPLQSIDELKMDQYNNRRGQSAALRLIKEKRWNIKNLEAKGLQSLRRKELKVLKPGLTIPKEPK